MKFEGLFTLALCCDLNTSTCKELEREENCVLKSCMSEC
eukprot:CAMPEP_0179447332 /NCGR_PEP_ID=MMETSP0799-20121207/31205_1 /TAXON_ID=46947 /ORGANISM="Geminigera cryophila, Strain CCMP2564" /LENGTH=38 /DNA_ID= /DNA_START= /DNA_END= /DNA_ORIENTATION=